VADAGALAYLALAPYAVMLAYLRSAALRAPALAAVVVADTGAPEYLALVLAAVVGTFLARRSRHFLLHIFTASFVPVTTDRFQRSVDKWKTIGNGERAIGTRAIFSFLFAASSPRGRLVIANG
jgi:hypothetical protein